MRVIPRKSTRLVRFQTPAPIINHFKGDYMKPLLLNRNSWHFRLATVYGSTYADYPREDICSYSGAVLKGFSRVLLFTLLVSIGVSVLYQIFFS